MIDTIKLNLYGSQVKRVNNLVIQSESYNGSDTGFDLFVNEDGEIKNGTKAYINNDLYNLSIYPKFDINEFQNFKRKKVYGTNDYIYSVRSKEEKHYFREFISQNFSGNDNCNFILQTSLSKAYSIMKNHPERNAVSLDSKQIAQTTAYLFNKIANDGIIVDIDNSTLIRLDNFVNLKTRYNFLTYKQIFEGVELSRKERVPYAADSTSILFRNKSSQLSIYDKKRDLENYKINLPFPLTRFENRLLSKRKINNEFGSNNVHLMLDRLSMIKQMEKVGNEIFNKKNSKFVIDKTIEDFLDNYSYDLRMLKNKIFYYQLSCLNQNYILPLLKEKLSRRTYYRVKKEMNQINLDKIIKKNVDLFGELREKYYTEIKELKKVA